MPTVRQELNVYIEQCVVFLAGGVAGGAGVDGPIWCVEVARGGCVFAWNFSVTKPAVLTETESRARPNMLSLPQ